MNTDRSYKYQIWSYELWKDSDNNYCVNNRFRDDVIILSFKTIKTDKGIIKALKKLGYIKKYFKFGNFIVDGENEYSLYVSYHSSKEYIPLFELEYIS
jgi:hypothetical protein